MVRRFALILLLSAIMLTGYVIVGLAGKATDTLILAHPGPVRNLDPPLDWYGSTSWLLRHMYVSLVWRDPATNEMYGQLAKSWEELSLVHKRFHLREGATFQNGEPLNAAAVKWNIDRILSHPEYMVYPQWTFIDHVEVVDEYTLDVFLKEPYAWWLMDIGYNGSGLVPPGYYEAVGGEEFNKHPIGSGPYKLVDYKPNEYYKLERWDEYWGPEKPGIKYIEFRIIPEMSTRVAALLSHEVDVVFDIDPIDVPRLEQAGIKHVSAPANMHQTLYLRKHLDVGHVSEVYPDYKPVFTDRLLRCAVDYALDRELLAEIRGGGVPARFRVLQTSKYALPEFYGESANIYDPDMARRYLDEWRKKYGYPPDYRPEIWLSAPYEYVGREADVAEMIKQMLEEVGFKVNLEIMGLDQYREQILGKGLNRDLCLNTIYSSVPMSGLFYTCDWEEPTYRYCDPELDVIIQRFRQAATEEERVKWYHEFERRWVWDRVEIVLYQINRIYGMNPNLNWPPRADGWMCFLHATWEEEDKPGGW